MREILFRGKRVDNKKWVYGYLSFIYWDVPEKARIYSPDEARSFDVITETIGQFTGLCDKNGTRIFEGDLVNYNGTIHKVVYENRFGNAYFGIVISDIETWKFSPSVPANMMKVIGNIHDNPELLEESK